MGATGQTAASQKSRSVLGQAKYGRERSLQSRAIDSSGHASRAEAGGPSRIPGPNKYYHRPELTQMNGLTSSTDIAAAARAHSSLGLSHVPRRNGQGA